MARSASDVAEIDKYKKTDYICTSKESERPAPDTLDETLPIRADEVYCRLRYFSHSSCLMVKPVTTFMFAFPVRTRA